MTQKTFALAVLFMTFLGSTALLPGRRVSGDYQQEKPRQMTRDQVGPGGETRVALVIGNGAYQYAGRLPNPLTDATEVSKAFREFGFDTVVETDCTKETMERLIDDFGVKLARAGTRAVGVFYYAGHGVQIKGSNYLIPVDARAQTESDVRYRAVDVDFILGKMEDANSGVNIVILDACRDNPFPRSLRNTYRGLAQVTAPRGTLIAYATSPGNVATDNGVYRTSLISAMRTPGLNVLEVFQEVGAMVDRETGGQQTPWLSSSLTGRFFFVPPVDSAAVKPAPPTNEKETDPKVVRDKLIRKFEEVRFEPRGLVLVMPDSYFIPVSSNKPVSLTAEAISKLDQLVEFLHLSTMKLRIESYSDNSGTEQSRTDFCTARGQLVMTYLTSWGVPQERIEAFSMGNANPSQPNSNPQGRTANRRIELILY